MKFSILIPAYKSAFLRQAIDSVLNQTYKNFELIVVDDNSPEELMSIVKNYSDYRVRFYQNERNSGALNVVDNWNKCLSYATGDYVICMGDDDELSDRCLEEYTKIINKYPGLDCYHTRMAYIDEESQIIDLQIDRAETESVYSAIWHTWKGRGHVIGDWLFSLSFLKRNKGYVKYPCAWSSDTITAFMAGSRSGVANTSYVGFRYRISNCTISSNNSDYIIPKLMSWCDVEKWYVSFLESKPDEDRDVFYWKYLCDNLKNEISFSKRMEVRKCFANDKMTLCRVLKNCNRCGLKKMTVIKEFLYSIVFSIYKNCQIG